MKREIKLGALIPALLLPLAVGALAAFITKDSMAVFGAIIKPPLAPPGWLFAPVWTALYLLMGYASYLVWTAEVSTIRRNRALKIYLLSLGANFLWPLIFFSLELYLLAFLWIILLALLSAAAALLFWHIDQSAGELMLPYLVWLAYAAYLNLGIWILN